MRWNSPEFGQVSCRIYPYGGKAWLYQSIGREHNKDHWQTVQKWADAGLDLRMNINLSVGQIIEPDFLDKIDTLFDETGAPLRRYVLRSQKVLLSMIWKR